MHRFSFTKKTAYYHNIKFGIFIKEGRQSEKGSNIVRVFKDGTIFSKEIMKERKKFCPKTHYDTYNKDKNK